MPRSSIRLHSVLPMPWERENKQERGLAEIEKAWGLRNGMTLVDGDKRYFYVKVAGAGVERPEVWAYWYFKNGNTHSKLERLDDWRVE